MNTPLIINPQSVKLLLWKNVYKNSKEIYYTLQIGNQRFISTIRQDKKGATYWRFRDYKKSVKEAAENPTSEPQNTTEAVANAPINNG